MPTTRAKMIDTIHLWLDDDAANQCSELIFNSYSSMTEEIWDEIYALLCAEHIPDNTKEKYIISILENLGKQ